MVLIHRVETVGNHCHRTSQLHETHLVRFPETLGEILVIDDQKNRATLDASSLVWQSV